MDSKTRRGDVFRWLSASLCSEQSDCLLFPFGCGADGYGLVWMNGKMVRAHRWVCQQTNGVPPSDAHHAAHSCGNRRCVNKHHLRWATRSENEADKIEHNRSNRGERQGKSKLSAVEVLQVRAYKGRQRSLAKELGVSEQVISSIKHRRSWAWL